jgi:hypothetical protein
MIKMKTAFGKSIRRMLLMWLAAGMTAGVVNEENEEPLKENEFYLKFKAGA